MAFSREVQQAVNGEVTLGFYKGNVLVRGRTSPNSLYDAATASMEGGRQLRSDGCGRFLARCKGLPSAGVKDALTPRKY